MAKLVILGYLFRNRIWENPTFGEKNRMRPAPGPGGFPWEATRQARSLDLEVSVVSMLGSDPPGDAVLDAVRATGADVQSVRRVPQTSEAEVLVHPGGGR